MYISNKNKIKIKSLHSDNKRFKKNMWLYQMSLCMSIVLVNKIQSNHINMRARKDISFFYKLF